MISGIMCYIYIIFALILFSCSAENAPKRADMVYIPSSEFIMGSNDVDTEGLAKEFGIRKGHFYEDEKPMRKIFLKGFYIDKYEVTNKKYKSFIDATGYPPPTLWRNGIYPADQHNYPVTNVTWFDAHAYCTWAGNRLPKEEEWEKAARGPDGNKYPWGNEYDEKKANTANETTMSVGSYETDRSFYGVYDMGGNVMEWVDAWYEPYHGNKLRNKDFEKRYRVLRGGSAVASEHYVLGKIFSRSSYRYYDDPSGRGEDGGFRCAADAKEKRQTMSKKQ